MRGVALLLPYSRTNGGAPLDFLIVDCTVILNYYITNFISLVYLY